MNLRKRMTALAATTTLAGLATLGMTAPAQATAAGPAAAASASAHSAASTRPASAAGASWRENNYRIAFYDARHITSHVCIGGVNQRETWTGHCWDTPGANTYFNGWYWHGCIHLIGYNANWSQKRWDAWFDVDRYAGAQSAGNGEFVWYTNDGQADGC
ncbi:hypothetical protein ACFOSC_31905 [Streptantibioticus rubrisoli]|uniref:Secreted protein n=1 Tax=Streptantibioticus rubrisoli TaxID=1387313 RepID=A0ABT1PCC2_9ACTN|nr:hypothetical protein [Streptantibioticus rubrisoli]MCQ4041878.1 hypothetical protein [Streptantibioticus rubrisoli]